MYLNVSTNETIEKDLEELFEMDADFSGNNGQDYLIAEAGELGFKSNAAYFANKAYNKFKGSMDLERMVMEMQTLFKKKEGSYWDINLKTLWHRDELVIAMSARPKNQG